MIEEVSRLELAIAARGSSVAEVCRRAGIARSTWTRWKTGKTEPNIKTWRHVEAAVAELPVASDFGPERGAA